MNLKEAFRLQNKLGTLMDEALAILGCDANILKVENTYLRKKVMEGAENETVPDAAPAEFAEKITLIGQLLAFLMGEREKLCRAIRDAKNALPIDMDSETSLNVKRQEIARAFRRMTDLRNSEVTIPGGGNGYRFNQEGNQVSYRCDVKRVATLNFNRNVIRNLGAELHRKSDGISAEIDRGLVTSAVNYVPPFDVNDSFAEVLAGFEERTA